MSANNSEAPDTSPGARSQIRNYRSEKKIAEFTRKNVSMEFIKKDLRSASESIQNSPKVTITSNSPGLGQTKLLQYAKKQSE